MVLFRISQTFLGAQKRKATEPITMILHYQDNNLHAAKFPIEQFVFNATAWNLDNYNVNYLSSLKQ